MKTTVIILSVFFYISNAVAQTIILPDKSAVIDTVKRAQCQQTVDEINTMQLKCDTVFVNYNDFAGICFDEKGQLRKYFRKIAWESESSTMFAYYNEDGELVYLSIYAENNCEDGTEIYYIYKGCIVDFAIDKDCGCCDEDLTQEEINSIRPVIGNPLEVSKNWGWNITNFIHAETLLKILKSEEYNGYEEFENYDETDDL